MRNLPSLIFIQFSSHYRNVLVIRDTHVSLIALVRVILLSCVTTSFDSTCIKIFIGKRSQQDSSCQYQQVKLEKCNIIILSKKGSLHILKPHFCLDLNKAAHIAFGEYCSLRWRARGQLVRNYIVHEQKI